MANVSVRLEADFRDIGARFSERTRRTLGLAVKGAVKAAADGLKLEMRQQVFSAGLGNRLGNAIGSKIFPPGNQGSLGAAAFVYPRGKGAENIFDAFNRGALIRGTHGNWLAIPTRNAGLGGRRGGRVSPAEYQARTGVKLRYVPIRSNLALLVTPSKRGKSVVIFRLIPEAQAKRLLNFEQLAGKWAGIIPELIDRAIPSDL